jgi:REP element-mobilizing transposase RayT
VAERKSKFVNNHFYHIFNRGVDKREIFLTPDDLTRFLQSMDEFNTTSPIGSIFQNSFNPLRSSTPKGGKLVNFICYCLNPNHYHFLLEQVADNGIEKFMQRLGTGYTNFFNNKNKRNGSLFQGRYKSILVDSNEYLLHLSSYINLNDKVHRLGSSTPKSSWGEYILGSHNDFNFCEKDIILGQFDNKEEYKKFAEESLENIKERKEMEKLLLE